MSIATRNMEEIRAELGDFPALFSFAGGNKTKISKRPTEAETPLTPERTVSKLVILGTPPIG